MRCGWGIRWVVVLFYLRQTLSLSHKHIGVSNVRVHVGPAAMPPRVPPPRGRPCVQSREAITSGSRGGISLLVELLTAAVVIG